MKNNIIAVLICVLTYVIVKMVMGDFTIESNTYGYYKNGKLNERGLISIVRDVKRKLPIYTEDTVVFDVNYTYQPAEDPKAVINYFHNVNKDKVDYYVKNSNVVAGNLILVQCRQQEIFEMLDKLDHFTVSFYDEKNFLYAVEISKIVCEKVLNVESKTETTSQVVVHKMAEDHVKTLNKNLPIEMNFGSLVTAKVDEQNVITHVFEIKHGKLDDFEKNKKEIKRKIKMAYCSNSKMKEVLQYIPMLLVQYQDGQNVVDSIKIEHSDCN